MKMNDLNQKQQAILDFLKQMHNERAYPPTVREIGEAVGLQSPSSVQFHLNALAEKGYIRRDKSKPRAIEVVPDLISKPEREMLDIPLLGNIAAGLPIMAMENQEDVFSMPLDFLPTNQELFMLRVKGNSMIDAGIFNGDLLILEHTSFARNGEIVAAMIDGEATVKTFYKEKGYFRLQPENSAMEPIIVPHVEIIGKVIAMFRKF